MSADIWVHDEDESVPHPIIAHTNALNEVSNGQHGRTSLRTTQERFLGAKRLKYRSLLPSLAMFIAKATELSGAVKAETPRGGAPATPPASRVRSARTIRALVQRSCFLPQALYKSDMDLVGMYEPAVSIVERNPTMLLFLCVAFLSE